MMCIAMSAFDSSVIIMLGGKSFIHRAVYLIVFQTCFFTVNNIQFTGPFRQEVAKKFQWIRKLLYSCNGFFICDCGDQI